jgi:hypothetical protein
MAKPEMETLERLANLRTLFIASPKKEMADGYISCC